MSVRYVLALRGLMQPVFLGGHPLIDFLNTSFDPEREHEVIGSGAAYIDWLVAAGLLEKAQAATLARRFGNKTLDAAAAEARKVREWARAWLERWRAHPESDYRKELGMLNELLARQSTSRKVVRAQGQLKIVDVPEPDTAAALIGLLAGQLAALLTTERPDLIKACGGPSCTLWFVDRTKAHRRRFCSAAACGNRAKVAAFRGRQRFQAERPT